jgi:hypothetical protein
MRCPNCDTRLITGLATCPECGASLLDERAEGSAARVLGTMAREDQGDLNLPRRPSLRAEPAAQDRRQDAPRERTGPSDGRGGPYEAYLSHAVDTPIRAARAGRTRAGGIALGLAAVVMLGTVLLGVFGVLGGASGERSPIAQALATPTFTLPPLDPPALLESSAEAMAGLKSVRYLAEAGFYEQGVAPSPEVTTTNALTITMHGDVVFPSSYTLTSDAISVGDYVVIGPDTWSRRNANPGWVRQSTATTNIGPANPLALAHLSRFAVPGTVQQVALELEGSSPLHHLRFEVDASRFAAEAPAGARAAFPPGSKITADVWVRESDNLPSAFYLSVDTGGGREVRVRTLLAGYNEVGAITPP